jgi:hypothetical protein
MKIELGANFAIFILFFGISLLEALQSGAWLKAALWLAIGSVFLIADKRAPKTS